MTTPHSYYTLPTLISVWSAMLGGGIGGAAGKLTGNVLYSAVLGSMFGAVSSVVIYILLSGLMYVIVRAIFQAELGEYTVGEYQGDTLSAILGSIAGLCGAVVVTLLLPSKNLKDPHAFAVCWSVVAFVPLVLALALLWRTKEA